MAAFFEQIWQYRGLVGSLIRRELRVRSLRAAWGSAWLVIQPAIQIAIYTLVFAHVLGAKLPGVTDPLAYGIHLCAGMLAWGFFAEIVTRSQTLFLEHAHLLKSIRFPRSTLLLTLLGTAALNFAIVAAVFLVFLLATGRWPGVVLLGAIPLLGVLALLATGIGVLGGTLNVFYRDVGQTIAVVLQFWFWLTPIVYPLSIVPTWLRDGLIWNPLYPLVKGFQAIAVEHRWPDPAGVPAAAVFSVAVALLGWTTFRALSADLVDEL